MKIDLKRIVLLLITIIFLYFVFRNIDLIELFEVIKGFEIKYLFLLSISIMISLSFRGLCFKYLISKSANPPLKVLAPLCISCAGLNIVLPARAGDFFRAFFVGKKYGVDKVKVFGTIMLERIFDVFTIFCFLIMGVFVYNRNEIAMSMCSVAGACIVLGIIFTILAYKFNKTDVICNFLIDKTRKLPISSFVEKVVGFVNKLCNSFFNGFEVIDSPKQIVFALLSSICIWIFECMNFLIVIKGFGFELHWSVALFIISFIAMACMIPSTSIFIGPYQLAVITAFSIYNVNKETALAISFVEQAIVTLTTCVVAVIFLLKNNISFEKLQEDIK